MCVRGRDRRAARLPEQAGDTLGHGLGVAGQAGVNEHRADQMLLIAGQAADDRELDVLAGRCQFKVTEPGPRNCLPQLFQAIPACLTEDNARS